MRAVIPNLWVTRSQYSELSRQKIIDGGVIIVNRENIDLMFPNAARVTFQPFLPLY